MKLFLIILIFLPRCQTAVPPASDVLTHKKPEIPIKTHYTLVAKPTVHQPDPLPDRTDYLITWYFSDESSTEAVEYIGWSFKKDGSIDMLEVLHDGEPSDFLVQ